MGSANHKGAEGLPKSAGTPQPDGSPILNSWDSNLLSNWTTKTTNPLRWFGKHIKSIAALSDGGFVITWDSGVLEKGRPERFAYYSDDIFAQRYDKDGNAVGGEFLVNTHLKDQQRSPSVAALSDGGFVITWHSYGQDHQDDDLLKPGTLSSIFSSDSGIYGQRYDAQGNAVGGEFLVNTYIKGGQTNPSVTGLADGGFVVTWSDYGYTLSTPNTLGTSSWRVYRPGGKWSDVYAQLYDAQGNAVGEEFQVNASDDGNLYGGKPLTVALSDGGFAIIFDTQGSYDANVQLYDAQGNAVGEEFMVTSKLYHTGKGAGKSSWADDFAVAALSDGGFVVTWTKWCTEYEVNKPGFREDISKDFTEIHAKQFDAQGNAVGEEFMVTNYNEGDNWGYPQRSSVVALSDGSFVVTWIVYSQIMGQRYDANNNPVGREFEINTGKDGELIIRSGSPLAIGLTDGGFAVAYDLDHRNTTDGDSLADIAIQRFDVPDPTAPDPAVPTPAPDLPAVPTPAPDLPAVPTPAPKPEPAPTPDPVSTTAPKPEPAPKPAPKPEPAPEPERAPQSGLPNTGTPQPDGASTGTRASTAIRAS
ncbi:MAG: hypothetical protein GDA36_05160 [Rhodobacteraceae bacterium]|nr:hypothetical protein [Paracoccaceae bacterium]